MKKKIITTIMVVLMLTVNNLSMNSISEAKSGIVEITENNIKHILDFGKSENDKKIVAIQNFFIRGSMIYVTQHIKDKELKKNYVKITRFAATHGLDTIKMGGEMWIENAGHGQTLEVYEYNRTVYILFSLKSNVKSSKDWSLQIGRIAFDRNTKDSAVPYTDFERLSALEYANQDMSVKSFGTTTRVDAAISSDENTILIWKRNEDNENELTAYDFYRFNLELDIAAKTKSKSVSMKINDNMRLAVRFSFNDKGKTRKIPNSVQGIELSNKEGTTYSIYVVSGDEGKESNMKIYRFNSKGEEKAQQTIRHSNFLKGVNLEPEGIHISGSKLQFLIVQSDYKNGAEINADKQRQYIMEIDKSLLN